MNKPKYLTRVFRAIRNRDISTGDPYGGYGALADQSDLRSFINNMAGFIPVNERTAMTVPAVNQAVTFISSTIAGLPIKAFREQRDASGQVNNIPIGQSWNYILNKRWNRYEPAFQSVQRLIKSILLYGKGYIYLARNKYGRVRELIVLSPNVVSYSSSTPQYWTVNTDWSSDYGLAPSSSRVPAEDIIYIPFLPMVDDPKMSEGLLKSGRHSIAVAITIMLYTAGYFDSIASGYFIAESPFTDKEMHRKFLRQLRDAVQDMVSSKSGIVGVPNSTKITAISPDNRKSQLHEMQVESVRQIARSCGVPKAMLNEYSDSTWSFQDLIMHFVNFVIKRWSDSISKSIEFGLFNIIGDNRKIIMDLAAIQRANPNERYKSNASRFNSGQVTINEMRAEDGLPPLDLPFCNEPFVQSATVPISLLEEMLKKSQQQPASNEEDDEEVDNANSNGDGNSNNKSLNRLKGILT